MKKSRCGRTDGDEYCGDIMMSLQDFEAWEDAELCDDEGAELCEDKDEEWREDEDEE